MIVSCHTACGVMLSKAFLWQTIYLTDAIRFYMIDLFTIIFMPVEFHSISGTQSRCTGFPSKVKRYIMVQVREKPVFYCRDFLLSENLQEYFIVKDTRLFVEINICIWLAFWWILRYSDFWWCMISFYSQGWVLSCRLFSTCVENWCGVKRYISNPLVLL